MKENVEVTGGVATSCLKRRLKHFVQNHIFAQSPPGQHPNVKHSVNIRWRERTNKMQLIRCLLSKKHTHRHYQPCLPQGHHGCHILCFHLLIGRTPHAVRHGIILLMMGIMVPETCWDRKFDNKRRIVSSCWFSLFTLCWRCTVTRT